MRSKNGPAAVIGAVCLVLVAMARDGGAPSGSPSDSGSSVTCAFSNPGYSGWCRQNVDVPKGRSARAACSSVLSCLNDLRCTKTYCDATTIRGGWKLAKIERPGAAPAR